MAIGDLQKLRTTIEAAFERRAEITPASVGAELKIAISASIGLLDSGQARWPRKIDGKWLVNEWLKKAVLLYFRSNENVVMDAGYTRFYDKVPMKYADATEADLRRGRAGCTARGCAPRAFIASNVVLMPSYVNIGAYVGSGTMVDTWATVGSCAQIGRNVHLSGVLGSAGCWSLSRPAHDHRGRLFYRGAVRSR